MFFDRQLWPFTDGVRLRIAWAVAVGVVAAALGIARLGLIGWLLGRVFSGAGFAELAVPFALVAAVMVVRGAVEYYRTMVAHHTASAVQQKLRQTLYDKVVGLGPAHFGRQRTGDVILTLVEGVEQLETYFGQYLPQFFVAAVTPVLIFAFVAFLDPTIATVLLLAALATLFAPIAWHRLDQRNSRMRAREYGAFAADFLDAIQGLATLKAFGQSAARTRLLESRADALFKSTMWVLATNTLSRGITDTGIAVGAAVSLGWGAWRVAAGEMSLTVLLVVLMLGVEVFRPLRDLRILLHQGMIGRSAATGILAFLATPPSIEATAGGGEGARELDAGVAFEDVSFAYPGSRRRAHDGLSFAVAAGERVAVVGPSGAGKSTIVNLLLRFFDPDAGTVRIGGRDIRTLAFEELRGRIAVVRQDAFLFHGTVEDNLRMGRPDATASELEAAARAANAHDFIARLPQGYATVVGERGVRLSAGQRQRVAIARALLRDAPILVLDEALSSVDAENEAVIQEALERLMAGRTTLIFAHRLSSVIDADRILVLDGGRIAESGRHAELIARDGPYRALMAPQLRDQDAGIVIGEGAAIAQDTEPEADMPAGQESFFERPTDAIIRAEGMSWLAVTAVLLRMIAPWRGQLATTFTLGVLRVGALIGVGVFSALIVLALKNGTGFDGYLVGLAVAAMLSGVLHWLESWLAHDMAYRLLADMRIAIFRKLDALAPAYFTRRRTGDLVGVATHDVEMVEYFFAHTIAPAFVAVVVPTAVVATLVVYGWEMAATLAPFLAFAGLQPLVARTRIDRLGSRARETLGDLNAHALDTVQGLGEVVAFGQEGGRGREFAVKTARYVQMRLPFFRDLTLQTVLQEVAASLGGLAVVMAGADLVDRGELAVGVLPLLTILAMSAFLPISEIAQVGRQLADTLGATRRVYAVHDEEVAVALGRGRRRRRGGGAGAGLRGRHLHLSRPHRAGAPARLAGGAERRHAGGGRPLGRRQDHAREPDPALLGPAGRRHQARGPRPARPRSRRAAPPLRAGRPGHPPVQRHPAQQHRHRPPRGKRRRDRSGGREGGPERLHRLAAGGDRHPGGRARHAALGRPAPAGDDRARLPQGGADPDPRRGHLASRRGQRGGRPRGARTADGGTHHHRHRPPAVDGARRRPHRRPRCRPHRRDRQPPRAARQERALRASGGAPARCAGGGMKGPRA